ncbi:unnamed protein product [Pylaiella littoralis]
MRPGEKEALFLAIQEDPPESESGTTRRAKKWTDIANRMLVVKDIDVTKQGVTNKVRVDYQQGRPPVDPKELGITLKNLFSRYKTNFDKEEKDSAKLTGEGTANPEERSEMEDDSEKWNLFMAIKMQKSAHETRVGRAATTREQQRKARGTRDIAALSTSVGSGGAAAGGRRGDARGGASDAGPAVRGGGHAARERGGGRGSRGGGRSSNGKGKAASRSRGPPAGSRSPSVVPPSGSQGSGAGPGLQQFQGSDDVRNANVSAVTSSAQSGQGATGGAGGSGHVDEDDKSERESAQIAADDTEATALSGGTLGRQQRSGQIGRTRATIYRGDPATFDGHQISSVLSMAVNKYADPNRGGAGSGGGLGGASVSGGGGGPGDIAATNSRLTAFEDGVKSIKDLLLQQQQQRVMSHPPPQIPAWPHPQWGPPGAPGGPYHPYSFGGMAAAGDPWQEFNRMCLLHLPCLGRGRVRRRVTVTRRADVVEVLQLFCLNLVSYFQLLQGQLVLPARLFACHALPLTPGRLQRGRRCRGGAVIRQAEYDRRAATPMALRRVFQGRRQDMRVGRDEEEGDHPRGPQKATGAARWLVVLREVVRGER